MINRISQTIFLITAIINLFDIVKSFKKKWEKHKLNIATIQNNYFF